MRLRRILALYLACLAVLWCIFVFTVDDQIYVALCHVGATVVKLQYSLIAGTFSKGMCVRLMFSNQAKSFVEESEILISPLREAPVGQDAMQPLSVVLRKEHDFIPTRKLLTCFFSFISMQKVQVCFLEVLKSHCGNCRKWGGSGWGSRRSRKWVYLEVNYNT